MPSFVDAVNGVNADASYIQQVIDALKGTVGKGIPITPTAVNDAISYALAVKNNDSGASKAFIVYKADGTILFQCDKNGVIASPDGITGASQIPTLTGTQTFTNKTLTAPHMTAPVVDSGGLVITAGGLTASGNDISTRRLRTSLGSTSLGTGDLSLSGEWGNTAAVTAVTGNDQRGSFTIIAQGTGIASSPQVFQTLQDGNWPTSDPVYLIRLTGGTGSGSEIPINCAPTNTGCHYQMFFTPVSGKTYTFSYIAMP